MTIPETISAAFVMGAVGSLHCIGMCGPLALALPMGHRNATGRAVGGALYNLGRITTYALLGLVLGLAGQVFLSGKAQQVFSIVLGAGILIYVLTPVKWKGLAGLTNATNKPLLKLRGALASLFSARHYGAHYLIGVLNGLLPCGLVYLAITSSFLTGSAIKGSLFMAAFGLGTFPAMLAVVFFGNYMNQQMRLRLRKAVPLFLLVMGTLLVLRGLNLGIPFISPQLPELAKGSAAACH
ncbi:sulfite exporter TauE/SafE family protein [Paracnuella aquatica]|uniref:sulfite exporter TauE/SafE family protein n=1 Tax=Paracnuella aquatica TaxID=2268757 RepID=UPI000DEF1F8E|nr:sulfite exporter TauE/SafE family protein [Paracnuella aquatica]RPD47360.1 sulfite exporter TauE/SafE family protein [Paracnuella aquatica]